MEAPPWQPPGRGWELVPEVPYESYMEFRVLLGELTKGYVELVRAAMERHITGQDLQLWSLAVYGMPWDFRRELCSLGKELFLGLTKGEGADWCELTNNFLVNTLDTTARVYVYSGVCFPETRVSYMVSETMENEVKRFITYGEISQFGYYSFQFRNFLYYGSSIDEAHADRHYMPVFKLREIVKAFAMGTHGRLGEGSLVRVLDADLVRLIFSYGVF